MMTDLIDRQQAIDALSKAGLINYAATGDGNGMIHAVNVIKAIPTASDWDRYSTKLWKEAYERGKRDAQPEVAKDTNVPSTDCISRQEAIDALDVLCQEHRYKIPGKEETYSQYNEAWQDSLDRAEGAIFNLPSAQPEIIRCTECKHYREYDSEYVENAVVVQCMADRYPISEIIPDGWFCAGAERKDNG